MNIEEVFKLGQVQAQTMLFDNNSLIEKIVSAYVEKTIAFIPEVKVSISKNQYFYSSVTYRFPELNICNFFTEEEKALVLVAGQVATLPFTTILNVEISKKIKKWVADNPSESNFISKINSKISHYSFDDISDSIFINSNKNYQLVLDFAFKRTLKRMIGDNLLDPKMVMKWIDNKINEINSENNFANKKNLKNKLMRINASMIEAISHYLSAEDLLPLKSHPRSSVRMIYFRKKGYNNCFEEMMEDKSSDIKKAAIMTLPLGDARICDIEITRETYAISKVLIQRAPKEHLVYLMGTKGIQTKKYMVELLKQRLQSPDY